MCRPWAANVVVVGNKRKIMKDKFTRQKSKSRVVNQIDAASEADQARNLFAAAIATATRTGKRTQGKDVASRNETQVGRRGGLGASA